MKMRAFLSFTAFAAMIVLALADFGSLGVRLRPPADRITVSMEVPDINGLVVGASVVLRGVFVGKVSSISTNRTQATVGFYIEDRYKIPVNSDVRLENLSALGETYIGLVPHTEAGPFLLDGQRIAATKVMQPPSISELATSVVRVLRQLDPAALQRIINEADTGMPNPTQVLPNLSRASMLLRNMATSRNGKGEELLDNFQTLLRNAGFVGPVLAELAPSISRIGTDFGFLFDLLANGLIAKRRLPPFVHFLKRIDALLKDRSGDIHVLVQSLLPYLNDISGALMNLDTGRLLGNLLETVPKDGVVTLHVSVPDR